MFSWRPDEIIFQSTLSVPLILLGKYTAVRQNTVMILWFRTDTSGQTVQTQITIYTMWHSVYIFWTHDTMVRPYCSNFRKITAMFFRWSNFSELSSLLSTCAALLYASLTVIVPFPFGVWGRMWNSTGSVPDHDHFIYLSYIKAI